MPPNGGESYKLHSMDMHGRHDQDDEYDQEDALLQNDSSELTPRKRVPRKNSDRTLIMLGIAGLVVIAALVLLLVYGLFGLRGTSKSPFDKRLELPRFGDIGCEFPGEAISPVLEQNLTLSRDSLEIVTTGRAIGDIIFHTEADDELDYVRMDVKLQGPRKDDLHAAYTRVREGRYELQTPDAAQGCMRYTLDVWLPRRLTSLGVKTDALTHMSFADIDLDSSIYQLDLRIAGDDSNNLLLLPEARIANAKYILNSGYVGGTTILYNSLKLEGGTAQVDVEIVLMRDDKSTETQYHDIDIETKTKGLCKTTVKNPQHFTFRGRHKSEDDTQMVLLYPESFAGELSMSTKQLYVRETVTEIPADGIVYVGAKGSIKSDLRVRNDFGSVYLSFDQ